MYERILTRAEIKETAKNRMRESRSKAILNWVLFGVILWAASLLVGLIGGNPFGGLINDLIYAASGGLSDEEVIFRIAQSLGAAIMASLITSILLFLLNLVVAPILEYGVYYNALRLYRNDSREGMDYKDLFIGFQEQFGRNFGAYLWKSLFLFLWGLVPIAGPILVTVKRYAYCMTSFVIVEHPEIDATQALKESIKLTSGHKWDLFVLDLSFMGWNFLSFFTLGLLPIFFLTPYKGITFAGFYTEYEKHTLGAGVGLHNKKRRGSDSRASFCARCGRRIDHGTLCAECAYERPKCPRCGAVLIDGRCPRCDAGSVYERPKCPRCGAILVDGRCPRCDAESVYERQKCTLCGAILMDGRCPNCSTKDSDGSRLIPPRWHHSDTHAPQDDPNFKPAEFD